MDHALMVLGFGEMREEDKPDESIWLDEPRLLEHFQARRAAQTDGTPDEDDEEFWAQKERNGETVQNTLAEEFMKEIQ